MNNVLFEIGIEELPARFIDDAEQQLLQKTKQWLKDERISYKEIKSFSTPRRLAILIEATSETQETIIEEVRGPSVEIAKDDSGEWSQAAHGFSKGQGKTVDDLYIKEVNGKPYVFIESKIEGKQTKEILKSFASLITKINFPQSMRWGSRSLHYARPIRWLVALYNDEIIPFEIAGLQTGRKSDGHRFLGTEINIETPLTYEEQLKENYVIANKHKRESMIEAGIATIEKKEGIEVLVNKNLLREVCHLVEYPTPFLGTFDESFQSLPADVLIIAMEEHQRYFPVVNKSGELQPYFIGVRNGTDKYMETVIAGNEKVLYARLADAAFFYEEDRQQALDEHLQMLDRIVFQEKLGTIRNKQERISQLTKYLSDKISLADEERGKALRTAEICKFDLPTLMVNEFPELQGVIGEQYALHYGESEDVAEAIREHYLPVQATDELPQSTISSLVSIADKVDTIVGCIAIGLIPTGSRDPYGLRRQGAAVLRILGEVDWPVTVEELIDQAAKQYIQTGIIDELSEAQHKEITNFFKRRLVHLFIERGLTHLVDKERIEKDVIDAVLHGTIGSIRHIIKKVKLLSERRQDEKYTTIQEALMRVLNIAKHPELAQEKVQAHLFQTHSEKQLYEAYEQVAERVALAEEKLNAPEAIDHIESLADKIHNFFEHNMVMDDDESIKHNRLTLLQHIASVILSFADLKKIEWRQHK